MAKAKEKAKKEEVEPYKATEADLAAHPDLDAKVGDELEFETEEEKARFLAETAEHEASTGEGTGKDKKPEPAKPGKSTKKSEESEEKVVMQTPGKGKLTLQGEVYRLYNGVGQLMQTGGLEVQKLYKEWVKRA